MKKTGTILIAVHLRNTVDVYLFDNIKQTDIKLKNISPNEVKKLNPREYPEYYI